MLSLPLNTRLRSQNYLFQLQLRLRLSNISISRAGASSDYSLWVLVYTAFNETVKFSWFFIYKEDRFRSLVCCSVIWNMIEYNNLVWIGAGSRSLNFIFRLLLWFRPNVSAPCNSGSATLLKWMFIQYRRLQNIYSFNYDVASKYILRHILQGLLPWDWFKKTWYHWIKQNKKTASNGWGNSLTNSIGGRLTS